MDTQEHIHLVQNALGERITAMRKDMGMTQGEFSQYIQMDRTYLSTVETGSRNISYENLLKISTGLGISASSLFEGMDDSILEQLRQE